MESVEVLALVGGHVEEEILLRNEYLAAENEILKSKLQGRPRFNDEERARLATLGKRLGRKALQDVGSIVKPDTILKWFRELVAKKFDGSMKRSYPGRPRIDPQIEKLIVDIARANPTWGYDRIPEALANLRHRISDQTVGNVLERNGLPPAPTRSKNTSWADFIRAHSGVDSRLRLLHRGGSVGWRPRDVLRSLLRTPCHPTCSHRRRYRTPERRVDEADRPQRNNDRVRISEWSSLPHS